MPADTPSAAADAPSTRPDDLVPMKEAAALVDRSVSSVRAWLRAGKLTKWREEPGNPGSRAMVSRAELMTYAATKLDPAPPRPTADPRPEPPASEAPATAPGEAADLRVEVARLRAELAGTRAVLDATRAHVATLEASADRATAGAAELVSAAGADARARAEAAEERARELRADLEQTRAELTGARAELATLRTAAGLPWWRKLLGGPAPALEADEH